MEVIRLDSALEKGIEIYYPRTRSMSQTVGLQDRLAVAGPTFDILMPRSVDGWEAVFVMKRSTDCILVTHQGTLPRPDDLGDMLSASSSGQPSDPAARAQRIQRAVQEAVQQQVDCGIDVVNNGEMSKTSFSDYVSARLGGLAPTAEPYVSPINGRDMREFPEYFASRRGFGNRQALGYRRVVFQCIAPLTYIGQSAVQTDIARQRSYGPLSSTTLCVISRQTVSACTCAGGAITVRTSMTSRCGTLSTSSSRYRPTATPS